MKITWVGAFDQIKEFPKSILPEDAKQIDSPESMESFANSSLLYFFPVVIVCFVFKIVKAQISETKAFDYEILQYLAVLGISVALSAICIFVHELLHAIVYPKKAEIMFGYFNEGGGLFIATTEKLKRGRYLCMLLLPAIVLGFIPLFAYTFLPSYTYLDIVFWFSFFSLLFCIGDFNSAILILRKVPRQAFIQNSGNNTYWFK